MYNSISQISLQVQRGKGSWPRSHARGDRFKTPNPPSLSFWVRQWSWLVTALICKHQKAVVYANITIKFDVPQMLSGIHGNLSQLNSKLFIFVWFGFLRPYLNKGCKSEEKSSYVLSEHFVGCLSVRCSVFLGPRVLNTRFIVLHKGVNKCYALKEKSDGPISSAFSPM